MKTRVFYTKFWNDSYIQGLTPTEKLLFIYLIANEHVGLVGAYELTIAEMEFRTGVKGVEKILSKFQEDGKVFYLDGYVIPINALKYQDYSKGNQWQKTAYEREFDLLPDNIQEIVSDWENITSRITSSTTTYTTIQNKNKSKSNNKNKNKKKKEKRKSLEAEVVSEEEVELQEVVQTYNQVFGKQTRSTKGFEKNFEYWREIHDIETMKQAIINARRDKFWREKMTLTILFRRRNTQGEDVDNIQDLSQRSAGEGSDVVFIS